MRYQSIDDIQKLTTGESMLFLAMLGVYLPLPGHRYESIELAQLLLDKEPIMPDWWNRLREDARLYFVQMAGPPKNWNSLVYPCWGMMRPEAQDAFRRCMVRKLRAVVERLTLAGKQGQEAAA